MQIPYLLPMFIAPNCTKVLTFVPHRKLKARSEKADDVIPSDTRPRSNWAAHSIMHWQARAAG